MNISNNRLIFSHAGYVDELTLQILLMKEVPWQIQYGELFFEIEGAKKAISIF